MFIGLYGPWIIALLLIFGDVLIPQADVYHSLVCMWFMGTKYFEENKSYPDGGNDNAYVLCIVNIRSRLKIMLTVKSNNFTFIRSKYFLHIDVPYI